MGRSPGGDDARTVRMGSDAPRTHRQESPRTYVPEAHRTSDPRDDSTGRAVRDRVDWRQPVAHRGRVYRLRHSELHTLETVGTFRVVAETDLARDAPDSGVFSADVRSLADQQLVERLTVSVNRQPTRALVLTAAGKHLLESQRERGTARQLYHAGLVKPRELSHDAQVYRLYRAESARIEAAGGRVTRIRLDYEIKHDYQAFLNHAGPGGSRDRSPETRAADRDTFAAAYHLPVVDAHLEIPDLRIEYETDDGRVEYRDVELVTEHYSRSQMAGKRQAGFRLYRASRSSSRTGGTPYDPHHVERMT